MKKIYGVLLITVSIILCLWCALSFLGLFMRLSEGLPSESYAIGKMVGQFIIYSLFGLLGIRAFKGGKTRVFATNDSGI